MIAGNTAAGVETSYGAPVFQNCLIDGNHGLLGGGVSVNEGVAVFVGCTLVGNDAAFGGGGVAVANRGRATLLNSILWGNTPDQIRVFDGTVSVTYCTVEGGFGGTGNLGADPRLVDPGARDFHLAGDSPCIDAGDPGYAPRPTERDGDDERRGWSASEGGVGVMDMGWDEHGSFRYGDMNCDGAIDFGDVHAFVLALTDATGYETTYPACEWTNADLTNDGLVDFGDIHAFVARLSEGN